MKKKVAIFRCDGGSNIGNGHIIRSYLLAIELKKKFIECYFLTKKINFFLKSLIKKEFKIIKIKKNSFEEIKKKIFNLKSDYFIIDDYNFSFDLEKKISQIVKKIIVIEDFPKKKYFSDLIIFQNLNIKSYKNIDNKKSKLLVGRKYSLIDPKLKKIKIKKNKNCIIKIFLCFGGFDGHKLNIKILHFLQFFKRKFNIEIFINRNDFYCKKILNYIKKKNISAKVYINCKLLDVLKKTDFAIISGGTIAKELIALNIPSLIISTSHDQIDNCLEYEKLKLAKYIGHWNNLKKKIFINNFSEVLDNEKIILNRRNKRFFDFQGVNRVSKEILKL